MDRLTTFITISSHLYKIEKFPQILRTKLSDVSNALKKRLPIIEVSFAICIKHQINNALMSHSEPNAES